MTIAHLSKLLEDAIVNGHGEARVVFDTEAKTFNYHIANIRDGFLELGFDSRDPLFILYEGNEK